MNQYEEDQFKVGLFHLDEAVGCFAQVSGNPVAYLFERIAATLVMTQESCEDCECESNFEKEVDKMCVGLNNKIMGLK